MPCGAVSAAALLARPLAIVDGSPATALAATRGPCMRSCLLMAGSCQTPASRQKRRCGRWLLRPRVGTAAPVRTVGHCTPMPLCQSCPAVSSAVLPPSFGVQDWKTSTCGNVPAMLWMSLPIASMCLCNCFLGLSSMHTTLRPAWLASSRQLRMAGWKSAALRTLAHQWSCRPTPRPGSNLRPVTVEKRAQLSGERGVDGK
mmetsp:Transcript_7445/g.20650  ORF Transcript_7445/g.20650 Transcript_7445/m.20650 type:complete len:201 (-) Transcript_7445:425-1027(-)